MNFLYGLLWLLLCLTKVGIFFTAAVPARVSKLYDYKIHVSGICPSSTDSPAEITVITDLPVTRPFAVCSNKQIVHFREISRSKWKLTVHFIMPDSLKQSCLFRRSGKRRSYLVNVHVPVTPYLLSSHLQTHVVTCNYDPIQQVSSNMLNVSDSILDSSGETKETLKSTGTEIKSNISLYVADIYGNKIRTLLRLGNLITLVAELIGDYPDELSFKVVSCRAIGNVGEFYFLSKGCGNGNIIPEKEGFITKNKKISSLPFPAFRIRGSSIVDFDCSFVICSKNCDGSSCMLANHRRKRAAVFLHIGDSSQPENEGAATNVDVQEDIIPSEMENYLVYSSDIFNKKSKMTSTDNGIVLSDDSSILEDDWEVAQLGEKFHKPIQSRLDTISSSLLEEQLKTLIYMVMKLENSKGTFVQYKIKSSVIKDHLLHPKHSLMRKMDSNDGEDLD